MSPNRSSAYHSSFWRCACLAFLACWPALLIAQPTNNNFSNAVPISGSFGSVAGMTIGATKEAGEPNHGGNAGGASVWYAWEAPASGDAEFDLHGSDFNTTIGAYTGSALAALTALAQNDNEFDYFPLASEWLVYGPESRIRFPAHAGTRYYVAVDGFNGGSGNFHLNWNLKPRPANDNFADAQVITGIEGFIAAYNVGASREVGEPDHATNAASASIWYRWTAPLTGITQFHTRNSFTSLPNFLDTVLAVYTGNSVSSLTPVASNDNNGASVWALVQFTASHS